MFYKVVQREKYYIPDPVATAKNCNMGLKPRLGRSKHRFFVKIAQNGASPYPDPGKPLPSFGMFSKVVVREKCYKTDPVAAT